MTVESIKRYLSSCKDKINVEEAYNKISNQLYDYELEPGNVICIFAYNKESYYEFSLATCPNKNLPRIKVDKV